MAWYNVSWSTRKKITLTGGASGAQTNYPLMLNIPYSAGMQSDFDDLRFTQSDGTTLVDCWLETHIASTSATVWVEFPTTPANTVDQIYYMYYGNAGVGNVWSGANTFTFIDEFNRANSATVGNGWSETGSSCISSNTLTTSSSSAASTVYRNFAFSGGSYAVDAKVKTAEHKKLGYLNIYDGAHISWFTMAQSSSNLDRVQSYLPTNTLLDPFSINTYYVLTNARIDATHFDYFMDYGNTGASFTNQAPSSATADDKLQIYVGYLTPYIWDWVKIRKYAQSPATYIFTSEGAPRCRVLFGPLRGPLGGFV